MATPKGPKPIAKSLDRLLATMQAPSVDVLDAVFSRWSEIVGPDVAAHTRPISIDGEVLTIAADDASWASEVRWLENELTKRLAEVSGSARIKAVKVSVQRRE